MADLLKLARKAEAVYHTTDFATRGMPAVRSDRCVSCGATNDLRDIVGPTGNWLVLCARCHVKQLDEKLNRPSVTDLSAPTAFRPPRPRRRVKPKPKETWRYPEGLALKHARLLIERGYPLEDVAETIGSRPDDLRRVLEIGHRD
jgi:hypothetical protein